MITTKHQLGQDMAYSMDVQLYQSDNYEGPSKDQPNSEIKLFFKPKLRCYFNQINIVFNKGQLIFASRHAQPSVDKHTTTRRKDTIKSPLNQT